MRNKEAIRQYDRYVRDPKLVEFYHSRDWAILREHQLNLFPLCQICGLNGRTEIADTVHHMLAISTKEGWARRLDLRYLQSLCLSCHSAIENEERVKGRGGYKNF